MSTFKFVGAVLLCGLLAGCGGPNKMYQPAAGAAPTQTAEAAYWDCARQGWQQPNIGWLPLPATQGMGAADEMAYIKACMVAKGWAQRTW